MRGDREKAKGGCEPLLPYLSSPLPPPLREGCCAVTALPRTDRWPPTTTIRFCHEHDIIPRDTVESGEKNEPGIRGNLSLENPENSMRLPLHGRF